jgi:alpha-L-fucosidase
MQWWREARFGMFVHWGLYSQLGRHEWVMNRERIPAGEYERLSRTWRARPGAAREWCRLARRAGMRYAVLTTKHHEGFCLWDSRQTDFNAVRRSPGRDLVREFVEACREFDLKVGFYYSLMDWRHPDGARSARSEPARRRFVEFTHGCVRELMTGYGKVDVLWYDVPWPGRTAAWWESRRMNRMVRELQPGIIINNRSFLPEDYATPEEHVTASRAGRDWEACMTFNGSWGYMPPAVDWRSVREVLGMLRTAAAGGGNLLLNIGPRPDGSVPVEAVERLVPVGRWLAANGEAVYGRVDRIGGRLERQPLGGWTLKGRDAYFWCHRWPGRELTIGGLRTRLRRASLLAGGRPVRFRQERDRLMLRGLPVGSPDRIAGVAVLKLEFAAVPRQVLGPGCVTVRYPGGRAWLGPNDPKAPSL